MNRLKFELPVRTTLLYLLFGSLWILLSDQILFLILPDSGQHPIYQTLKGWFFILVSGVLLYFLLLREYHERKLAEKGLSRHAKNTATLYELSQQIHTSLDLNQVYENAHQAAGKLMACDAFVIALLDETAGEIEYVYLWDMDRRWPGGERHPTGRGISSYVISSGTTLRVNKWDETHSEMTGSSLFGNVEADTQSVLAVPLFRTNGKCFGMLSAQTYAAHAYTIEHEQLLVTLANQISKAIENAQIFNELQNELSERKKAEQALRKSEALYRQAIEVAGAVPYRQSYPREEFHIHYEFIGEGIRQLTGYGADEFNEAVWDTLVQESHLLGELTKYPWREAVQRVRTGASPIWQCEHRIQTRQGEIRWVFEAAVELRDEQGASHGSIGMFQDITERKQAEQALRQSEALYRQAIEVAGAVPYYESYYDHDKKIKYEFIGEGIRQITGYGPEEFTATLWDTLVEEIFLVDELEGYSLDAAIERVRGGQNPIWKCEHRIRHRNGEIRWIFEAAVELRDEHGASHGSIGMYQDITARKLAEAALRENEKRLSLFFDQSLDGFFFSMLDEPIEWDTASDKEELLDYVLTHQHITEANDAMIEQYGSTRNKFIGRTANDFFAHDLEQARRFRRNLFDSAHLHIDTEERKDDGTPIWIEGDYVCMRNTQNRIIGMFGIQRDATLRKKAEDELRASENRFRNLVESLTQVIYTTEISSNGRWSYVSPQIEKLLGFTPQEWMANPGLWYQQVHPDDRDKQNELEQQAYLRGEPFEGEYRIAARDGKWIWVRDSGQILPPSDNGVPIVQGTLVDIAERKQAEEQIQKQFRRLNTLHTIDMAINSSANIQITLEVLLNQLLSQLNVDATDVLLFNQAAQTLELTAERGFRSTGALPQYQRLGDFFAGQVINQRHTLHIPNMMEAGRQLKRTPMLMNESFTEYIGVPLIAKGQVKGVLEIYQRSPLNINEDWLNFLEVLGGRAAMAIDNSQLLQSLQRSNMDIILAYDATIEGWSRAMDLRDKETEGHTQRVTTMTLKLARAMGIREADIIHIQRGGLLHDIGKLGVPDNILLKAGELTKSEWEIMRQHPTFAFNLLAPIAYLKHAIDIPYCHHEKWDGTGYPRGLEGEQIPLAARIFAIADVWDALTSDRPYRAAWSHEKVLAYIQEQSGKQFDPQVVEAFMKTITIEP